MVSERYQYSLRVTAPLGVAMRSRHFRRTRPLRNRDDTMTSPSSNPLYSLAILRALPDRRDELLAALQRLIEPTRAEPGNQDYVLFESRSEPGTFYMREAFDDQAALDAHFATPHFQSFAKQVDALLAAPLELLFLDRRSE